MSNVVNLNRFRKQKKRADAEKQAEENRAEFGRTKAQRKKEKAEQKQHADHIDGHKREDE